jgi:hypothetical protein
MSTTWTRGLENQNGVCLASILHEGNEVQEKSGFEYSYLLGAPYFPAPGLPVDSIEAVS